MDALDALNKANEDSKTDSDVFVIDVRKGGSHSVGGRPKKLPSEKRTHKITTYFSSTELDALSKYCDSIGVQPAAFLRTQAMNKVKKNG